MTGVQRIRRTKRQSDPMETQLVVGTDPRQLRTMCAARREIVLAVNFEPADRGTACDDFFVVLYAQPDSRTERGAGWVCRGIPETHRTPALICRVSASHQRRAHRCPLAA